MARGRARGGMYGPPHGSGPRFPLHNHGPPQPEEHWMGPPHRDGPGQNFMRGPTPRYRMPMGRMPEPQFHAGPRPMHRPVDMKPMDYRPNNDIDLRFGQGSDMPNDYHFEADRPRVDSGHFPSRMYDNGADDNPEYAPMERGLPRPMDYEPGPNRFRPEHERGHVEPLFEPVEYNFGPDRRGIGPRGHHRPMEPECGPDVRRFGPGDHFGQMESGCGLDSRQFGAGDRFGPVESDFEQEAHCALGDRFGQNDVDFRQDRRQFGPGDNLGQNQNESDFMQDRHQSGPGHFRQVGSDFGRGTRRCGPRGRFGPMEPDFGPDTRRCGPGDHFGQNESDFGPDTRRCGPGDHFGQNESDFGPDSRRCGPGDRFGPMEPDFGPDSRRCGPGDHFGQNESDFGPDSRRCGPGDRFGSVDSDFRQDRRQFVPGDHFVQMEPDFLPDRRHCEPVDDSVPVNSSLSQEEDHFTPVSQRLGPIDDRVRPFDPHFEPEDDIFVPDNQLPEEVKGEEESFLPVDQMVVNVGPVERTVIIGSVVENRDFPLDTPVERAPPLFPIRVEDPACDGPACLPGSWPTAPSPVPTPEPHPPPPPQNRAAAVAESPKKTAKAPTAATAQHKPPPGRSTGVISFIGDNHGIIERDDLKRFSFSFSVFMGKIKNLVPGVKVHFTVFKNKKKQEFATDVSIPPGGMEELDTEVFMGVVNKHITEGSNGGLIEATPYGKLLVLPFGKADCKWTLFMNDRVTFQVVTNLVTRAKRAASVKPQFPDTVKFTREKREMGVIMSIKDGSCSIMSENHSNLQANIRENLTEGELAIMDEVEFTPLPEGAVRLLKLPGGSVKFHSSAKNQEMKELSEANATMKSKWKPFGAASTVEQEVVEEFSSEFFDGTVLRLPAKDKEAANNMFNSNKELLLGSLQTSMGGVRKELSFSADDVVTKATMLVGDKVQFKIATNPKTKAERAVSVEVLPGTFEGTEDQRKTGVVVGLSNIFEFGYIKYLQDPELYFKFCEVMEEKELTLLERVEFTVVSKTAPETGEQAIRVKRLSESVFSPAPKLEGLGTVDKEKKKMTINLLKDSVQMQHVGIKTDLGGPNIVKTEELSVCAKNAKITTEPSKEDLNEVKQSTKDAMVTRVTVKEDKSEDKQSIKKVVTKEAQKQNMSEAKQLKAKEDSAGKEKSTSLKNVSESSSKNQDRDRRSDDRHQSSSKDERRTGSKETSERDRKSRSRSRERRKRSRSRSRDRSKETSSSSQKKGNRSRSRSQDRSGRSDHRSRRSSSREGRRGLNKGKSDKDRSRSRSRDRSRRSRSRSRSRSKSRDRSGKTERHRSHRSSSRERRQGGSKEKSDRDRRGRSRSKDRSTRHRHSRSRSRDRDSERNRERDRDKDRDRRRSHSLERKDERRGRRSSSRDRSTWKHSRSRSSSPKRKTTFPTSKPPLTSTSGLFSRSLPVTTPVPTSEVAKEQVAKSGTVDKELARKKKELEELNEVIARKRAIVALEQKKRAPVVDPKVQPGWIAQPLPAAHREEIPKWPSLSSYDPNQDVKLSTTPIKSILKKPTQSFLESTSPSKDERGPEPLKPPVPQPLASRLFPIPGPSDHPDPPLHQLGLTFPVQSLRSIHPAVPETPSAPHPSCVTEHSFPQQRLNPPLQQMAPEAKSNASVQMQRFLKLLNQGVDTNLLSAMVKEAKEESAAIEQQQSLPPHMESNRNEPYDPFTANEEQEYSGKDDLLPHERAVEDGSGFSRIVGMKPGLYVEDQFLKTSRVEEEEHYLYGDTVAEDERSTRQYSQGPQLYKTSMPPDQSREGMLARLRQHTEMAATAGSKQPEKQQSFDRIQNLFKALGIEGIDLNSSTVSQLTDRTRERLYGGKMATASSEPKKRKHSPSRHRSRTDSSDSDRFRSASPDKPPKRQVFMSYRDQPQHDAKTDLHTGKKRMSLDLRGLTRTIRNTPESATLQTPESIAGSQASVLRPDPSQFTYQAPTVRDYAYPDESPYAAPPYTEPSYTPSPFVVDHSALPPPPPSVYNPYTLAAGQTYPPLAYPPPPVMSSAGIPGPGLPPLHPPMPPSSPYSSVLYPPNPSSTHSYVEPQLPATSIAPILQSQPVQSISTVKSRCLKVIETTAVEDSKVPIILQTKPTLTEDDVKERQKKRLEQINQRLKEKNVKLMEARKTKRNESTTGNDTSEEVKNVWICGHSLVTLAEKISRQSPEVAMPLSMDPDSVRICWKGVHGMTWDQLVPQLHQLKLNWPNPDLLIIHLGGNDINKGTAEDLLSSIKRDLTSIRNIFPQCLIVWSDILPRRKWKQGILPMEQVDRIRALINCRVHAMLAELGGTAVTHENIGPELYCPDGVRLSKKGIEAFNLNLEDFLEKWKNEVCQEASSN